jgi:hypothetical protein
MQIELTNKELLTLEYLGLTAQEFISSKLSAYDISDIEIRKTRLIRRWQELPEDRRVELETAAVSLRDKEDGKLNL